jgi:enoyl-CoA hydratase/carnithine racemase
LPVRYNCLTDKQEPEMSEQTVLLREQKGEVLWLTLNRPEQLNALNLELVTELRETFESLRRDHAVRVVVLRASGKAFCAGLDLNDANWSGKPTPNEMLEFQRSISDIYRAMRQCPQPIISLVQGAACGGGFSLALASDIRIAADTAKMNAAYIKAGLTACDMACSYLLPRLVGLSVASELMMTGRFINAERALKVNMVSEVVPEDQLDQAAEGFVEDLLSTSPMGLRLTKDGLNVSVDAASLEAAMALEDRQQSLVAMTEDAKEAVAAFLEKRQPVWKDR